METTLITSIVKNKSLEERWVASKTALKYEEECTFAIEAISKNELLQRCATDAKDTIQMAVYKVALLGITLNPVMQFAYLIPRYNNKAGRYEANLDISYKGMVDVLTKSGGVKRIYAYLVYEGDQFEVELGSDEPKVMHKPMFTSTNIQYAYAVAIMPDGGKMFDVMTKADLDYIKSRSESGKKDMGPWKSDYGEQCRKTVIRRLWKILPKNDANLRAFEAVQLDNDNVQIDFEAEQRVQLADKKQKQITGSIQKILDKAKTTSEVVVINEAEEALNTIRGECDNMNTLEELAEYERQIDIPSIEDEAQRKKVEEIFEARKTKLKK